MGFPAASTLLVSWLCLLANVVCLLGQNDASSSIPQCITNEECDGLLTCIDLKCQDPCPGVCQGNSSCEMHNHVPYCSCRPGYSGDPFTGCQQVPPTDCPPAGTPSGRKVYRVEQFTKVNFFGSVIHCQTHGGRLASIATKQENDFIKEEIRKSRIRNDQFWTSGTTLPRGHWVWMSSSQPLPDFADWEAGTPDDPKDEQCLAFSEKDSNGYAWNDKNCWQEFYPICEYFQ